MAAVCNGLVLPAFAAAAIKDDTAPGKVEHMILLYNNLMNHAPSRIWITAACVSLLCWSGVMFAARGRWNLLGAAGAAIGSLTLVWLFSGRLENNVLDAGLFAFGAALWTAAFGVATCRAPAGHSAAA